MICRVEPPSTGSTARYYSFDETDIDQVCTFDNYIISPWFYPVLEIQIDFFVLLLFNTMSSLAKTDFVDN